MTYFENNLIFHKKEKKSVVNIVQFLMKFFVLLYINSPVFEKQIKPAKNRRRFISLQHVFPCVFSLRPFLRGGLSCLVHMGLCTSGYIQKSK